MNNNKLYEYKNLSRTAPIYYSGNLSVITNDDVHHDITSPVNKLTGSNDSVSSLTFIGANTLSGSTGKVKFNISFKAHKDMFAAGSRKIFGIDGLIAIESSGDLLRVNKLYNNTFFYISKEYLVNSGFNNFTITGDGVDIKLDINNHIWTVNTDIIEAESYIRYSGFADDTSYLTIPQFYTNNMSSFTQKVKFNIQSGIDYGNNHIGIIDSGLNGGGSNTSTRLTHSYYNGERRLTVRMSTSGSQSYYFTIVGSEALPLDTEIIGQLKYSSSTGYQLSHSNDGGATWIIDGTNSTTNRPYSAAGITPFMVGENVGSGDAFVFRGYIDLVGTKFTRNDMIVFDGIKAVQGIDYDVVGTPTKTEYIERYPNLNIGALRTYHYSWMNLKDINAVLIEER